MSLDVHARVDCVGLFCPMPVLRVREAMRGLGPGAVVEMLADDPSAEADMRSWTGRTGHELLLVQHDGDVWRFLLRKAG